MGKALFSKTKIQKNSNSIIQNGSSNVVVVQTGIPNVLKFDETRKIDWSIRKIKEMQEICPRRFGVKDSLERAVRIDNYLERILFCSIKENVSPTLRLYGHFSPFSTIKGQINHSDLDKLELSEKRRMLEWAQNGYPVKVIISLQPSLICEMSYDLEQYDERCADLERSLTSLEDYKNVQFVVDDVCELDSLYIFDTLFYCASRNDDLDKVSATYVSTDFVPDLAFVKNKIRTFDKRFEMLKEQNKYLIKGMELTGERQYIHNVSKIRKENYLEEDDL